jgi:hypothetical protein
MAVRKSSDKHPQFFRAKKLNLANNPNLGGTFLSSKLALAILAALPCGFAGTIINTNLPAGDVIVDINGQQDGAANYGGPNQDLWYQPFNTTSTLLEVTLQPGTYAFRAINSTDAAAMFPALTGTQLAEIRGGAWTFNSPWTTDYMVFDSSAASNPNEAQLFSGAISASGSTYGSAATAYSAAVIGAYYDQIVVGGGRYTGTTASQFTISGAPETLIFVVPDYFLPDNNGIESVLITPVTGAVPEPSAFIPLALFLVLMVVCGKSDRQAKPPVPPSCT